MSLPYDLALRLRAAGFAFRAKDIDIALYPGHPEDCPCLPTLEELVDACGEGFDGLIINRGLLSTTESKWSAAGSGYIGLGNTPLIAVAHLWLAINEKV